MLERELARKLLPLVNDHDAFELLKQYAEARIAAHHKSMEQEEDVRKYQGAIAELRRIFSLRDEVIGDSRRDAHTKETR